MIKKLLYSNRAVVFLDILGFREAIKSTALNEALLDKVSGAIHSIRRPHFDEYLSQTALIIRGKRSSEPKVTQFSDSIVISRPEHEIAELVLDTAQAIHGLISSGMVCRGSIAIGKLIHNEQLLFGPAMLTAYENESVQPFPAVILTNKIALKVFNSRCGTVLKGTWLNPSNILFAKEILKTLSDEYYFVDYFNHYERVVQYEDGALHFKNMREMIVNNYLTSQNEKVREKYAWMITMFNNSNVIANNGLKPIFLNSLVK